jgi:serine/threonine protein kinase
LADSAEQPRYVETVARKGYRFIAQLMPDEPRPEAAQPPSVGPTRVAGDLSGRTVSHYLVYEKIGQGGMGEVYRARDAKLGRDVAIKVLPEEFARDAERMARFQREAKFLASLNHSNIASIYGLEDSDSTRALVMELVEGSTLADRIRSGPIPMDEALPIARQICDALEYAHERGIVHRDLKPSNIKVTSDDTVKILDFGLAKAIKGDGSSTDIPNRAFCWAPRHTCRRSRPKGSWWIAARTSGHSAACCTKCSRARWRFAVRQ